MEELKAGEQVQLELCPVYARHTSVKPSLKKSGTFYLWDDKIVNRRIRITNDKNKVGTIGYITGWVNVSNIRNDNLFKVGDRVLVNGIVTTYADGTGNSMTKRNSAMYIVEILSNSTFKYNYAVATDINRARQGWACLDSLKKL